MLRQTPEQVVARARTRAEAAQELQKIQAANPDPSNPALCTDPSVVRHWGRTTRRTAKAAITYATERKLRVERRDHERALADERQAARLDRRAATLEAARDESSNERAVLALSAVRGRALGALLGISVALSIGSAIGLAALSAHLTGRAVDGGIAELAGTAISTAALVYLAHLHRWSTGAPSAAVGVLLWVMAFVPTGISAAANIAGIVIGAPVSFLNVVCAVGALSASALAYLVARASSAEIRARGDQLTGQAAEQVREERDALLAATGPGLAGDGGEQGAVSAPPADVALAEELGDLEDQERRRALDRVLDDTASLAMVLDLLADRATRGGAAVPMSAELLDHAPRAQGAAQAEEPPEGGQGSPAPAQGGQPGRSDAQEVPARAQGGAIPEATPEAVRAYRRAYPELSLSKVAQHFGISRRSVRRYLDGGGS